MNLTNFATMATDWEIFQRKSALIDPSSSLKVPSELSKEQINWLF